jgi:hypothetical protein
MSVLLYLSLDFDALCRLYFRLCSIGESDFNSESRVVLISLLRLFVFIWMGNWNDLRGGVRLISLLSKRMGVPRFASLIFLIPWKDIDNFMNINNENEWGSNKQLQLVSSPPQITAANSCLPFRGSPIRILDFSWFTLLVDLLSIANLRKSWCYVSRFDEIF